MLLDFTIVLFSKKIITSMVIKISFFKVPLTTLRWEVLSSGEDLGEAFNLSTGHSEIHNRPKFQDFEPMRSEFALYLVQFHATRANPS